MKRVFICSPYAGDIDYNVKVAQQLCKQAVYQGYAPFAPHLIYPQFLSDVSERHMGIDSGCAFMAVCDEVWRLKDEMSPGMIQEINYAAHLGIPVRVVEMERIPV
jgi:hypothetical protein